MTTPTISSGILNLPGTDHASRTRAAELLKQDHDKHHCFFNDRRFHNHLSHHLFAIYDLGASASLIQAANDFNAAMQRPIDFEADYESAGKSVNEITEQTWEQYVEQPNAYAAYVRFFTKKVEEMGSLAAVEKYVFSPQAQGVQMLARFVGAFMHPYIHVAYGLEFNMPSQVAVGLAMTAVHEHENPTAGPYSDSPSKQAYTRPSKGRQPESGPSILAILKELYTSPKLRWSASTAFDRNLEFGPNVQAFLGDKERRAEFARIMAQFEPGQTDAALAQRAEEFLFVSVLIASSWPSPDPATGKPRIHFVIMHLVTTALWLPLFLRTLSTLEHKRALLRHVFREWGSMLVYTGLPHIDVRRLMAYPANPRPPGYAPRLSSGALGACKGEEAGAWPDVVTAILHSQEAHISKMLRSLVYGAREYGAMPKGDLIGAFDADGKETVEGAAEVDGTIFVRAAGALVETHGWVTHGEPAGEWVFGGTPWKA